MSYFQARLSNKWQLYIYTEKISYINAILAAYKYLYTNKFGLV